jgi:hypothetical protein
VGARNYSKSVSACHPPTACMCTSRATVRSHNSKRESAESVHVLGEVFSNQPIVIGVSPYLHGPAIQRLEVSLHQPTLESGEGNTGTREMKHLVRSIAPTIS